MTENEKIGIWMFFNTLRGLGAFQKYMRNYMDYHQLASQKMVPEALSNNVSKECNRSYKCMCVCDRAPIIWMCYYISTFTTYAVSFPWCSTDEETQFWEDINIQLNKLTPKTK